MFRHTDRQMQLVTAASQLPSGTRRRLEQSWAEGFQRKVLPILLDAEERFAELYGTTGRPNWSVACIVGLLILQDMQDLDDQSVLDALAFDLRYQRALGLEPDEAYLSRRSFVGFRSRLVEVDPEMTRLRDVFEAVGEAALAELGVSVSEQRIDSTRITSNIRTHGRVDLFGKTLRHCLDRIGDGWPQALDRLSPELLGWYRHDAKGWFGKPTREQRRARLQQRAEWLVEVMETFRDHEEISADESYQLVVRILEEQCELVECSDEGDTDDDGDGGDSDDGDDGGSSGADTSERPEVKVRKRPEPAGASMQSPHDPDATYGHKGSGYHAQITETCGNDGPELITDYDVHGAHISDQHRSDEALERLDEAGWRPARLYADAGYANGDSIIESAQDGTELYAPFHTGALPSDYIGREAFRFGNDGCITACPRGHAPTRHGRRSTRNAAEPTLHAYFDGAICRACPLEGRCAARPPNSRHKGSYYLEILPKLRARDEGLAAQRDDAWWDPYRLRAGVEATMSELKRGHGIGHLRVRRMPRVRMRVALKVTACNVKRWLRARPEAAPGPTHDRHHLTPWISALHRARATYEALLHLLSDLATAQSRPPSTATTPVVVHAA